MKTYRLHAYASMGMHARFDDALALTRESYNAALTDRRERWCLGRQSVTKYEQYKTLTELRREMPECSNVLLVILREPIDRLDKAYQSLFRRVKAKGKPGHPRYL